MRSPGFQRFVAVIVGILLGLAVLFAIVTKDESLILPTALVAVLYAIYLSVFLKREKERRSKRTAEKKSPLLR
jgi:threonine/homoserine/homoserine lactone efflux protein